MRTLSDPPPVLASEPPPPSSEQTAEEWRVRLARAEAALHEHQARLTRMQGALHAMPDAVVVVDQSGRITEFNLGAVHLTGWPERNALEQPLHDVVKLRDAQGRGVDLLSPDSRGGHDVAALVRNDEHQVLVDASCAPILDAERNRLGAVVTFRNVTAAKRITDELTYQALHDPLTGASNRRAFESRLKRAVAHAAEHGTPHALLYLDLDRFKAVNDRGGHFAGDELLRSLSALLQRSLREQDMLARLGGDEFVMLLEHCVPEEAEAVAERIRTAVEEFRFHWQDEVFEVGASIGLVTFRSGALSPQRLMLRADEMCYLAKEQGRNQVRADDADRRQRRVGPGKNGGGDRPLKQ